MSLWLLQVPRLGVTFIVTGASRARAILVHCQDLQLKTTTWITMPTDAVGDSMQSQPTFSAAPAQAALSDDCSAVKLKNPDPAQDGATSMPHPHAAAVRGPAQQTQQAVTSSSVQQQPIQSHEAAAPCTSRHCRKREQPPPEEEQQHAVPSTGTPGCADVAEDLAASAEQDGLQAAVSPHKGKQEASQVSGGPTEAPLKKNGRAAASASG